ncbi:hypothetical protein ACH4XT_17150 [Streptomyces avidinii]|uniref:hypothetical protein n=1 Tax=Streptomyces avidinii TaxID=1895 RepID=UPI0037A7094F
MSRSQAGMATGRATARRLSRACLVTAVAAALLSGCGQGSKKPSPAPASSSAQASAAPGTGSGPGAGGAPAGGASPVPDPGPGESVDFKNPEAVAMAFASAYTKRNWKEDPGPRTHLEQIKPYTAAAYLKSLRDAGGDRCDLECEQAKKSNVRVTAEELAAVTPPEAPASDTERWVQVSYIVRTSWDGGGDSNRAGMAVQLRLSDGKWLVTGRARG